MSDIKFEDALGRLEQIVDQLEAGELPLEASLKAFEEGVALAPRCAKYLEEAEKRIELLTKDQAGPVQNHNLQWGQDQDGGAATAPPTWPTAPRPSMGPSIVSSPASPYRPSPSTRPCATASSRAASACALCSWPRARRRWGARWRR